MARRRAHLGGSVPRARARARPAPVARSAPAEADGPRCAGSLSRRRARGSVARRSRQPPTGRLAGATRDVAGVAARRPVDDANVKLYVTWKTLGLRAEHAAAFAGSYEPVAAGGGVCAYVRGGEVLVAAAVRPDATVHLPTGWRDVLGVEGLALCCPTSARGARRLRLTREAEGSASAGSARRPAPARPRDDPARPPMSCVTRFSAALRPARRPRSCSTCCCSSPTCRKPSVRRAAARCSASPTICCARLVDSRSS